MARPGCHLPLSDLKQRVASQKVVSSLLRERPKCCLHLLKESRVQGFLEVLLAVPRQLKFHGGDLCDKVTHGVVDCIPTNLGFASALSNCLLRTLMKPDDNPHHPYRLGQWAEKVIFSEAILLKEIFTDDFSYLQR